MLLCSANSVLPFLDMCDLGLNFSYELKCHLEEKKMPLLEPILFTGALSFWLVSKLYISQFSPEEKEIHIHSPKKIFRTLTSLSI